ncbi:uncharacterized protein JCM6883_006946 [Sporobolomyces salmoneus]|uniref:uncharacterized protein n=1 Tax=Sporobolomyces salmoneus TaxID=183962 RepID=UPI00317B5F43
MESYPTEFTFQISPLLFVAGLNPPSTSNGAPPEAPAPTDPFDILTAALRKTFASRRGFQLWDNSRGQNHEFHTLLVDKNIRFPPLKARPTSTSTSSSPSSVPTPPGSVALHSPISPLTPTSPLYPDGIIAPIWIRKHRELIPSVFILVLRLFESPSANGGPIDLEAREEAEHEHDDRLIREIIDRKRSTLERGIKLAVVLLCSRELLDDPSLDVRLSLIRRQSGLDSRASLFVISPVPQSEVQNFLNSIRTELWTAAIDYYREHGRRVRRKRARSNPPKGTTTTGGLSERGWNVRYDYKLALFAEMRGEVEVALKHYEDCYESLVDMFSQPGLLVARTKRWAEAKVLADCLTVKIAKLYLYLNDPSHALSQLNRHVFRFRQLSESWSIGEETFEFWSWLSKQYRLFGDLTTAALRAGFRLPSLRPPPTPIPTPGVPQPPSPGLMPLNVLQHPGHYYFLSAVCAFERRERYRTIKARLEAGQMENTPEGALVHEGKVDHTEIIIELYTKSYEHFKHHLRRRTTYYLASLIASAHASGSPSPNVEMALKFWDRIGRNYRKEGWEQVVEGIEEAVFECAKQGGRWKEAIKAAWNLITPESNVSVDRRAQFAQELKSILTTRAPGISEQAGIRFESDMSPILVPRLNFLRPTSTISNLVPFQLAISSPSHARLSSFTFDSLEIHFNDDRPPVTVRHAPTEDSPSGKVERYEIKREESETKADLRWKDGTTKVFYGTVSSEVAISLTVEKVVLDLSIGEWSLAVDLQLVEKSASMWYLDRERTVPLESETSVCSIMPRVLDLAVDIKHSQPAYLGERYPIELDIKNEDDIEVEISLVGFIQPDSRLSIVAHSSTSLLDSIPLGVLAPHQSLRKTLCLECLSLVGDRHLDLTIRSSPSSSIPDHSAKPTSTESNHSLVVPCLTPFLSTFQAYVYPKRTRTKSLSEEKEGEGWKGAGDATVSCQIKVRGPWGVEVVEIRTEEDETLDARVKMSSLDSLVSELPMRLEPTDALGAVFALRVKPLLMSTQGPPRMPSLVVSWRRSDSNESATTTILPFPAVRQLPLLPRVSLRVPHSLTVNVPTPLEYLLTNSTPRTLHLATQIDHPVQPNSLAFAGPRHSTGIVLQPREERIVQVRIAPLVPGKLVIPRFRIYEYEQPTGPPEVDQDGRPLAPRMRELEVETEFSKEPAELVEVGEEKVEMGEIDGLARVQVLPSRSYPPEQ